MDRFTYSGEDNANDFDKDRHEERRGQNDSRRRTDKGNRRQRQSGGSNDRRGREARNNDSFLGKVKAYFQQKRTRVALGLILIFVAGYLAVAALSFFKSGAQDQSVIAKESIEQLSQTPDVVENVAGPVGAKISHHLFVEGLGLGSIVLIVYMILLGLSFLGVRKARFWPLTFKSLILAITVSFVLGLMTINSSSAIPLGGYHGYYMNTWLISHVGWIGAIIFNGILVLIVVTVYINELASFYSKYRQRMRTLRDRRIHESDKERYRKESIADAMSGTPMDAQVEVEEPRPRHKPTPIVSAFNIPSTDEVDDSDPQTALDETSQRDERSGKAAEAGAQADTAAAEATETLFNVNQPQEIEQAPDQAAELVAAAGPYDPKAELSRYRMPSITLLHDRPRKNNSVDLTEQDENKERIEKTLNDYGIAISKIEATVGPTVTLYEIVPAEGVRIARIKRLEDDIALSLAALGIRIIAPIPGKGTIGIEVPNKDPQTVSIRSILGSKAFQESKYQLPMALGATISNDVYIADLAKMPHLLVAGATGQGKSVGLNTIIASLLYKRHPSELKFVLVDPKMVEFSLYACLEKFYLAKLPDEVEPVVTDPTKVVDTLNSLCVEMDSRYALLKEAGCRSILEYNDKFINRRLNPEKGHRYMPYIVMIVDEFADLIMVSGKAVETPIARIAQKARAVGMHMIIATQRPSTNVITGIIKANFPGRIGFRVSQMVDSRTILDSPGANQLIGRGDMLISHNGSMDRVQCAFIDTDEVEAICAHISNQVGFPTAYILPEPPTENGEPAESINLGERDTLFEEVGRYVVLNTTASTSNIQRKYAIGYNRAGKIMDQLEAAGVVGPASGGKPRQVLMSPMDFDMMISTSKS